MPPLYRLLSFRYVRQRWDRAALVVASIALGVSTLVSSRILNQCIETAAEQTTTPLHGSADLYVTNGNVSLDQNRSYWYDYSKVAGGNRTIISDAANWPPLAGRSLSGYQQKRVWISDGQGHFHEVAQMVGITDRYDGRSVALALKGAVYRTARQNPRPQKSPQRRRAFLRSATQIGRLPYLLSGFLGGSATTLASTS